MTDRGVPSTDGSPACPFVAFEDERDARADRPDHRHRCFAETEPAPRALAHQEAYCLSSAFPVCPTFQDWARREAAHAIPGQAGAPEEAGVAAVATGGVMAPAAGDAGRFGDADDADDGDDDPWSHPAPELPLEERPRRNPPRDWAAPPPWASGLGGAGAAGAAGPGGRGPRDDGPDAHAAHQEGQGLAGSAADRLARGDEIGEDWAPRPATRARSASVDDRSTPADPELAGLVSRAARQAEESESHVDVRPPTRAGRRPTVSSTRDRGRERERDRDRERERASVDRDHEGPSWERARRYEAYPSIKTRAGLSGFSGIPTIGVLFGGVVLAALILFFLPGLLGVGREEPVGGPSASPSSAVEETPSASPTPVPEPTPQVYVIKTGDTLSRIARQFNVSLDALLAANKERISNPNRIRVGDEIIIPLPETTEVPAEPSPS
ncbi:MAG TPA: LysM peptidoglycan-binding domain-containing protein [Candidatus Limnocylindrales bacterium]|nr:LysM peptidoglycan-binding domain-containing protein [Candidatus Limnocylindrales bacterium]